MQREKKERIQEEGMMSGVVRDEGVIQNRECESGLDPTEVDEDGRPKRTGYFSLFLSYFLVFLNYQFQCPIF